ncbi:MAG: stage III sporulation protein AF [Lachnospiraceae bacterium]|nr:stage III sporulation protein AF [Lachnospiraceae bacterium]
MGDSEILSMICRIGIFIVCAQTVIHFRPNSSYEKYFKLLISMMILAQMIQPLSEIFAREESENLENRIRRIQEELDRQMQDYSLELVPFEEVLERMTMEEVNLYLQEQEELNGKVSDWEEEK